MSAPEGFRRCRQKRCKNLIADRYPFDVCTPCVMRAMRGWRLDQELEAEKAKRALTKLRSKVMKDNWRHRREAAAAAARRGSV